MHVLPLLLVLLVIGCIAAAPKGALFVAPGGDDAWSGVLEAPNAAGTDGPFATVAKAQEAARAARVADPAAEVTLQIRGGEYALEGPLVFTPEDSGCTYEAYPGEKPIFTGGTRITGWQKGEGGLWTAHVPAVEAGDWYFNQLFVNGRRCTRARTPNEGTFHIAGKLEGEADGKLGFRYQGEDLRQFANPEDVTLVVYHSWTASLQWIKALDEAAKTVTFTAPCGWPVGYWDGNQRYHVENCLEALDAPGEWYLNRKTGVLSYWPLEGEDMTAAEVVAPRLQHLVEIKGDAGIGLPVEDLHLRGLSFQYADWKHDRNEEADGQAAIHLSAAVVATGMRDGSFEGCEIGHVGEYAMILGDGCKGNRVVKCHIHDLGGGGVRIGNTYLPQAEAEQASNNVVDNCFIHDGGHVFQAGIGVWIGRSSYNTISHNDICDFYYSGCSVGWSWGYAESTANHNVFEYNHIHDLGKWMLSDMGGIYSLGISPGTVERYNVIHDVYSYNYGGWGLYTDEGSTDVLLENNVVYNTKSGGFHQHYGQHNLIRNNIFGFAIEDNCKSSRDDLPNSLTFQRNIVLTHNGQPLGGRLGLDRFTLDHNLYWDVTGEEPDFLGNSFAEWQARGKDEGSVVADPLFVDGAKRDFRLKEGSPAFKLGFETFDVSDAGLYGDAEWKALPKGVVREPYEFPAAEEPKLLSDDFEDTAVGELAKGGYASGEENGASIRVTDEVAAAGKHSLKFLDAPGLSHEWQPHLVYKPALRKGVVRFSFDVRLEPGATFWHEWRDAAEPYRVGPSLRIEQGGELRVGGKTLLTVPRSEWAHIEMRCGLGAQCTRTWDLSVTLPGQAAQEFRGLACGSAEFRRLEWLGFISLATETAVMYLDEVRMVRE